MVGPSALNEDSYGHINEAKQATRAHRASRKRKHQGLESLPWNSLHSHPELAQWSTPADPRDVGRSPECRVIKALGRAVAGGFFEEAD